MDESLIVALSSACLSLALCVASLAYAIYLHHKKVKEKREALARSVVVCPACTCEIPFSDVSKYLKESE